MSDSIPVSRPLPVTVLRTGAEIPSPAAVATYLNLELLFTTNVIAFYELVCLARSPEHQLFPGTGPTLAELGFLDHHGRLHEICRALVLASALGDGENMTFLPYSAIISEVKADDTVSMNFHKRISVGKLSRPASEMMWESPRSDDDGGTRTGE